MLTLRLRSFTQFFSSATVKSIKSQNFVKSGFSKSSIIIVRNESIHHGSSQHSSASVVLWESRNLISAASTSVRGYSATNRKMSDEKPAETVTATANGSGADRTKCIFCKIVDGKEENEIFYQDDEIVVFQDIKPAAKHHLLVVPREHIRDCKSLVPSQLPLLERLIRVGNQVLQEQIQKDGGSASTTELPKLMGFHWPPFHTVSHLHLHVIAPSDQMGFIARTIFRPGSLWFVTDDYVRDRLQKMANESN